MSRIAQRLQDLGIVLPPPMDVSTMSFEVEIEAEVVIS